MEGGSYSIEVWACLNDAVITIHICTMLDHGGTSAPTVQWLVTNLLPGPCHHIDFISLGWGSCLSGFPIPAVQGAGLSTVSANLQTQNREGASALFSQPGRSFYSDYFKTLNLILPLEFLQFSFSFMKSTIDRPFGLKTLNRNSQPLRARSTLSIWNILVSAFFFSKDTRRASLPLWYYIVLFLMQQGLGRDWENIFLVV